MNMTAKTLLALLTLSASAILANAQDFGGPPPGGERPPGEMGPPNGPEGRGLRPPPRSLLFEALDANHDGIIDSNEIANAAAALKKLDKNGDGKLTPDELWPQRPRNRESDWGPPGPNGQGRPPGPPGQPPGGDDLGRPPRPGPDGQGPPQGPPPNN